MSEYALEMVKSGFVHRPPVVETLVIDLTNHDGIITSQDVETIHENTKWRFRYCVWFKGSGVRKAIFTRFI